MSGAPCLTVIASVAPDRLGKRYVIGPDGALAKTVATITKGVATTIEATPEALARSLAEAAELTNQVVVLGSFIGAKPGDPAEIHVVTESALVRLTGSEIGDPPPGAPGYFTVGGRYVSARLKRLMDEPCFILLDCDSPVGMPPELSELDLDDRLYCLEPILPGISTCLRIQYRGSTSRVVNGSGALRPEATHAIIEISDPSRLDLLRSYLRVELVRQGLSFPSPRFSRREPGKIIGYSHLTLVDWSVWCAGRLIFNAAPDISGAPNYRVLDANVEIVNPRGGVLDIGWLKPPEPKSLEEFETATGSVLELDPSGRGAARELGMLTLLTEIELRGTVKRLGDWLPWMLDNDIVKLRCEAPFRASVSDAAFIRVLDNCDAFVHDSGTSTNYPLGSLPQTADDDAEAMTKAVIAALERRAKRQAKAASTASPKTGAGWRTPDPLPDGLLPVAPFDLAFLPASLAPWVADIADLMQCPPDYVAIPAMTALGATIGRKIAIRPQRNTDWSEVANLWALIIGPPGVMKSPAMAEATKPLRRLEMEARKANEAALKVHAIAIEDHKTRMEAAQKRFKEALKKDPNAAAPTPLAEPVEPKTRRYIVDDATYEKLGEILVNSPNGVLAYRDELMSLLKTLDREEYAAARGFFLAAWGGKDGYTFDRILRGTQHIEAACVSLLGGTQPGRLADFVKRSIDGGQGDDGMLQRFGLAVWPDIGPWREVDRYPDGVAKQAAFEVFRRLDQLDPYAIGAVQDAFDPVPYLKFDREAQEIFSAWHRHLEISVLRGGDELSPALKGHFSKYRKLVPALALINHLADGVGYGEIGRAAIVRAVSFSRYLETHARRIYAAGVQNETAAAKAILTRIKRGDLADGFTARDVRRHSWANVASVDQVKAGLDLLIDFGWLADKQVKRLDGGRPTVTYFINPLG